MLKKLDDYDSTSDKWLDEKIKDDDGNEQVAREWIKDQAKKMCLSYLVVDEQLKKENVNIGQATLDSATSQAETYWNVGPYASQGYVMPMKKQYEKYGVSLDSFAYCTTLYNTKYEALFKAVYGKGRFKGSFRRRPYKVFQGKLYGLLISSHEPLYINKR